MSDKPTSFNGEEAQDINPEKVNGEINSQEQNTETESTVPENGTSLNTEETLHETSESLPESEKIPISEILYGVVFTPAKTFSLFRFHQPWLKALVFFLASNLLLTLFYFLGTEWEKVLTTLPKDMSAYLQPIRANTGIFMGIIFMPLSLLFFTLYVSFMHFLSEAAGGQGQVLGLFSAFAFAQIISIINAVLNFFANMLGNYGGMVSAFLALVFLIWQMAVHIIAIRQNYILSTLKAVVVFFLPFIMGAGVIIFMVAAAVAFFMPLFGSINSLTL